MPACGALATLLASLATAPARNVVVTGANSGVGLAGAKILTASGHRVTLACRTLAKAESAAAACEAFAKERDGTGAGYREGGTAAAAECDLADLESVRWDSMGPWSHAGGSPAKNSRACCLLRRCARLQQAAKGCPSTRWCLMRAWL